MEKIFNLASLANYAEKALIDCFDYITQNRIQSAWTLKYAGWQEQWNHSKFTGLFATCNALLLLINYPDRYTNAINDAIEEMYYMFNSDIDYANKADDSVEEKKRKGRCRLLLEQNLHTTLKAVYFLMAYEALRAKKIQIPKFFKIDNIAQTVYNQIEKSYNEKTGEFWPALENEQDVSILTTMQAFMLMKDKWGKTDHRIVKTKQLLLSYVDDYIEYSTRTYAFGSKFDIYKIKSCFVSAVYALSNCTNILSEEEKEKLVSGFFLAMADVDIRKGFAIKDCYSVPNTLIACDTYVLDARLLYLTAAVNIVKNKIVSLYTIEYFLDDIADIIDTTTQMKQYLAWDSAPSFSYNIKGIAILEKVVETLKEIKEDYSVCQVYPRIQGGTYRSILPMSVVLFMSFSTPYSESIQESVQEVLKHMGFEVWWATNDPYDAFIVDNILEKLSRAQFAIIDCSERSANVMYEAGWAHGLGKPALLCGSHNEVFPYESATPYKTCNFESNGEINPPPYRDLQKGIIDYVVDNINEFCLTDSQKKEILEKASSFVKCYCV